MDAKLAEPGSRSETAEIVLKELRKRIFDRFKVSTENFVATLLDPGLKNVPWLDDYIPKDKNGYGMNARFQLLKETAEHFGITAEGQDQGDIPTPTDTSTNENEVLKTRMKLFMDLGLPCGRPLQSKSSVDQEITDYLAFEISEIPSSPKAWWDCNGKRFPILKQLFEAFLSAMPSSASSEQAFSKAGKFMSAARSNLSPLKLNMLCFINAHIDILEEYRDIFTT